MLQNSACSLAIQPLFQTHGVDGFHRACTHTGTNQRVLNRIFLFAQANPAGIRRYILSLSLLFANKIWIGVQSLEILLCVQ